MKYEAKTPLPSISWKSVLPGSIEEDDIRHQCEGGEQQDLLRVENQNWWIMGAEDFGSIYYCPFCGEKLPQ